MRVSIFIISLLFIGVIGKTLGQTTLYIIPYDTVEVKIENIGIPNPDDFEITWEESYNLNDWTKQEEFSGLTTLSKVIIDYPVYYRAVLSKQGCSTEYSDTLFIDSEYQIWSDNSTWESGSVPIDAELVVIPAGKRVLLDENTALLSGLQIDGELRFLDTDLQLSSTYITVGGLLQVGTEESPFLNNAIITLNDTNANNDIMGMGTRGIMVHNGGKLELHGAVPSPVWTRIIEHGESGVSQLVLEDNVGWKEGSNIVVAPTDYYEAANGASITHNTNILSVNGNQVELEQSLNAFYWGLLQYPTSNGISLDPTNLVSPPLANTETTSTPLVLDERAEVGNLTRNIVIEAPNDDLWNNEGFGVHTMIMPNSEAHVEGVEFRRAGQRGRIRRYPFHWHMLSYDGVNTLEDANGQYFNNNSINHSANRGVVIHGTNGVTVDNNVIYDVRGHGVFLEDAVERRNIVSNNLVLHVRNPEWGFQLLEHEVGNRGSSGFWISNPDNVFINNVAADCQTNGYWLAFPSHPWGISQSVLAEDGQVLNPSRLLFGTFEGNTAHSNGKEGIMIDNVQIDEQGNTFPYQYRSTTDGREINWPYETLRRFELKRLKIWKNGGNGIWDRAVWATNSEIVSADNCGRFFAGSGADGIIQRSLIVGNSLNFLMNGTDRPLNADPSVGAESSAPVAFATYHSSFSMTDNIITNFPYVYGERSGVFATDDYYVRPVDKGQIRNTNNLIIDSHPGVKLFAPYSYFTLASALYDANGNWGPAGNYFVYDIPFLTYGKEVINVPPDDGVGGVSVAGPFYGFSNFILHGGNTVQKDLMAIFVRRLNETLEEVGTWSVTAAQEGWAFDHMRDFATSPDGIYELTFPEEVTHPTDFIMLVENMMTTDDWQLMSIQFDGTISNINVYMQRENTNFFEVYEKLNSLDEVRNSNGASFWQDTAGNKVWVKMRGGVWQSNEFDTSDDVLNEPTLLYITPGG